MVSMLSLPAGSASLAWTCAVIDHDVFRELGGTSMMILCRRVQT